MVVSPVVSGFEFAVGLRVVRVERVVLVVLASAIIVFNLCKLGVLGRYGNGLRVLS